MSKRRNSENEDKIEYEVNKAVNESVYFENGNTKAFVCIVCNKFLLRHQVSYIKKEILEKKKDLLELKFPVPLEVKNYYTYSGAGLSEILKQMVLSKDRVFNQRNMKFISCKNCSQDVLRRNVTPKFAICN